MQAKKWACRSRPEILLGGYPTTGKRLHINAAPIYCCVDSHSKARMHVVHITVRKNDRIQAGSVCEMPAENSNKNNAGE